MCRPWARPAAAAPDPRRRALLGNAVRLGFVAACGLPAAAAAASALVVGEPAPPLVLNTLDGRRIATQDLVGQVVIATFWATWCEPCREELPMFSDYARRHAQDGLQVLGFSLDGPEAIAKVKAVAATLSFPVGLLGSAYAGAYGRIWQIPVSFIIDRAGRLARNGWDVAPLPWTQELLQRIVGPLLPRGA